MITDMALSYRKLKYQSVFSAVSNPCTTQKTCQNLNKKVGKNATFKTVRATLRN